MKRQFALLTAVAICFSLLAGCGDSAAERRQAAEERFDISLQEYKRNQEYYDTILDLIAEEESGTNGDSGLNWNDGSNSDTETGSVQTVFTEEELLDIVHTKNRALMAVKKGDTFYTNALFTPEDDIRYGKMDSGCTTTGFGWKWPDISYSNGDSIVIFSPDGKKTEDSFILRPYTRIGYCLPFVFEKYNNNHNNREAGNLYLLNMFDGWESSLVEGTTRTPDINIETIDGVPFAASPRFFHQYTYDSFGYTQDVCYITGELGEQVTLAGKEYDTNSRDYNKYVPNPALQYTCTLEFYKVPFNRIGYHSTDIKIGYAYVSDGSDDPDEKGNALLRGEDVRPIGGNYLILTDANTQRAPSGDYILTGFPITITD